VDREVLDAEDRYPTDRLKPQSAGQDLERGRHHLPIDEAGFAGFEDETQVRGRKIGPRGDDGVDPFFAQDAG
jgi:hypothetical protein